MCAEPDGGCAVINYRNERRAFRALSDARSSQPAAVKEDAWRFLLDKWAADTESSSSESDEGKDKTTDKGKDDASFDPLELDKLAKLPFVTILRKLNEIALTEADAPEQDDHEDEPYEDEDALYADDLYGNEDEAPLGGGPEVV